MADDAPECPQTALEATEKPQDDKRVFLVTIPLPGCPERFEVCRPITVEACVAIVELLLKKTTGGPTNIQVEVINYG